MLGVEGKWDYEIHPRAVPRGMAAPSAVKGWQKFTGFAPKMAF